MGDLSCISFGTKSSAYQIKHVETYNSEKECRCICKRILLAIVYCEISQYPEKDFNNKSAFECKIEDDRENN